MKQCQHMDNVVKVLGKLKGLVSIQKTTYTMNKTQFIHNHKK